MALDLEASRAHLASATCWVFSRATNVNRTSALTYVRAQLFAVSLLGGIAILKACYRRPEYILNFSRVLVPCWPLLRFELGKRSVGTYRVHFRRFLDLSAGHASHHARITAGGDS